MPFFRIAAAALAVILVSSDARAIGPDPDGRSPVNPAKKPDGTSSPINVDASGNAVVVPPICSTTAQSVVSVGATAVLVPASPLSGRKTLRVCVSLENAGSPKVKCLLGGTPVMGVANPGDVLAPGDCYPYAIDSSVVVKCIADTAGTAVTTFECS